MKQHFRIAERVILLGQAKAKGANKKMTKYTQKQLRAMVADGIAENITNADNNVREELEKKEGWLQQVGYSAGVYGCNGMLLQGRNSGTLYAITARTSAIFIFG